MSSTLIDASERLREHGFRVSYAANRDDARTQVLEIIPKGSTIGIGDSVTIRQIGAVEALQAAGCVVVDLFSKQICELTNKRQISMKQRSIIARTALRCEFFLTGSNAVTQDGVVVNIDGYGNRVAGMICGPENAVLVVGRNKLVANTEEALYRIRNVITPEHARTKSKDTPCAATGRCVDCNSRERLCSVTTIIERAPGYITTYMVLVDDDLGLGWDESWPEDRIARISESYASYTWLKLGTRTPS